MFNLAGKNAYITGGSSGIGRAVAETFIASGARVVIADIVDASEVAAAIGATAVRCNVAEETRVRDSLQAATSILGGPLDIVVLNAGVGDVGPNLTEIEQPLIDKVTRVNHWGVMYGLKHAPAAMNDGGAIISTSSMAAFISVPGSAVYSASKRAVTSLTEMAALELGGRGIRVNCICPGYTDTAMGSGDEGRLLCEAFTALGRAASVDDLTGVFLFLASDASRYMTGQALKVDGGWHCGPTPQLLRLVTGNEQAPS
jgi:NAD(P)-dependent dehydrogenase (short-subunit alcohol dehydrogenase family)